MADQSHHSPDSTDDHASQPKFQPLNPYIPDEPPEIATRQFLNIMSKRRSVRDFSDRPVPRALIETIIATAGTAPSGANKQPWSFVAVSDHDLKHEIRLAAENEEREFYNRRASKRWLNDLSPLGTDEHKPFLDIAPWLIIVFKKVRDNQGGQAYYIDESVGIAVGLLLAAAHLAGLATLTHTPSPMKFLTQILNRPANERPYLLIPTGYPAPDCRVPAITRKPLNEILFFNRK